MKKIVLNISFLCIAIAGVAQESSHRKTIHRFMRDIVADSILAEGLKDEYFHFREGYSQIKTEIDSLLFLHFDRLRAECSSGFKVMTYEEARDVEGFVEIIDDELQRAFFIKCRGADLYPIKTNENGKIVSFMLLNKAGRRYFLPF